MIRLASTLLGLVMILTGATVIPTEANANASPSPWIKPVEKETTDAIKGGSHKKQVYTFGDGDVYWMHQVTGQQNQKPYVLTIPIKGDSVTFRYRAISENKQPYWAVVNLRDVRVLPQASGFVETEGKSIWMGKPIVYTAMGRGTIDEKRGMALPIEVNRSPNGYTLSIPMPVRAGYVSEMWALESREPLVVWGKESLDSIWLSLDVTDNAKWLYDGYYYKSPSTYEPYTESSYWRIPENYVLRSFLYTGGSKAARDMGYVMLKTSLKQQDPLGYWKSLPRSQWLKEDYGIPEGFYDTRFNTGAAELMLKGCAQYEEAEFCESAQKYAAFFQQHAVGNHYVIEGIRPGWLVGDYASVGREGNTHVSLNHQLAEINYLYSSYLQFGSPTDKDLADIMLGGVINLGSKWILSNGDLHYAYFPDGTFGRADYPYLTYNDLVETQRLYQLLHGMEDATIAKLIESKLAWMKQNNVAYQPAK
ncbi:hypothetical protein [Brevibacillus choshinensis]|uniref:D-glucuronyl C5-epimerase C-terminal domain-containing protein n=1 Tax=Brevibacillus choshinensis TaxID=54911 RepID=A0ABX7FJF3_BRECH|nr:hypothetical protein [Brevibacillus choshinensis]QRG66343.1 hypothetical protein JNE38_22805 [Brevibacillus choshinensis]